MKTEIVALAMMQGILALTFLYAIFAQMRSWLTPLSASATVQRGDQSMNSLYVLYGVATLVYSLTIDVADAMQGNKASIILLDYVILTYLFFFSSWFRNRVVFRLLMRIRRD